MGLAEAVDAPRWLFGRAWRAPAASLRVEDRFAGLLRLAERGHPVEELGQPYLDALGHAGMLVKHRRDGRVEACTTRGRTAGPLWFGV